MLTENRKKSIAANKRIAKITEAMIIPAVERPRAEKISDLLDANTIPSIESIKPVSPAAKAP